jgi:DNA-binding CsgD family transcriptional regulator
MMIVASQTRLKRPPTDAELEVLDMIGAGVSIQEASVELNRNYYSLIGRVNRLKVLTGKPTLASLVHWGLTEGYIYYPPQNLSRIHHHYLEVVQLLAQGQPKGKICEALFLSKGQFERRVRMAREGVSARNHSHLVAICETEGWLS